MKFLRRTYWYPFYAVNEGIRRGVARAAAGCSGGTLLDIGCGTRPYDDLFAVDRRFGFDLLGSPRPIDKKRPDVWFDGATIPIRDNSAQHLLCAAVLQYCRNPDRYMGEFARILQSGGNLILVAPQSEALTEEPFDRFRYTLAGIRDLCATHSLQVVEAWPAVGFWQTMAFHVNCMAVQTILKRNRLLAMLVCPPLAMATQTAAAVLDRFTAYDSDTNSWIVRAVKS